MALTAGHWPPYVELLVRANIAVVDPAGTRMKLVNI